MRLDDLAGTAKVSKQFLSDVEYGKATVQMGLVFKLLAEIGVSLKLELPQQAGPELTALRLKGGLGARKKRSPTASAAKSAGMRKAQEE